MTNRRRREDHFKARMLFRRGFTLEEISAEMGVPRKTLFYWRQEEKWDAEIPAQGVEDKITQRTLVLIDKETKTDQERKDLALFIDKIGDLAVKLATARQLDRMNPTAEDKAAAKKEKHAERAKKGWVGRRKNAPVKNDVSEVSHALLDEVREKLFWDYQKLWNARKDDKETRRNRFMLKSRQIGATYYFAWEALEDAIKTGDNQIFLSASRDQAEVFRAYIVAFASQHLKLELTGNPILLSNGAELRFLSTNSRTAQSYHGHLYLDEVFWIPQFAKLWKLASGMAAHKKWRRTLFSTPSALSHEAYALWSGENFNKGKPEKAKVEFDLSHATLKDGQLGADKFWRHVVTVEDAERLGCDLFDIDELRSEYSSDDFDNLFLCKFIDDAKSVFPLSMLLSCGVEAGFEDYDEHAARPFGNRPVALGYDPSRSRDDASLVIMAVPLRPRDAWRVLHRLSFRRQSFQYQANRIKEIVQSHNVVHVGIDVSGMGWGVYELVAGFYPQVEPITYSVQVKTQLVVKALDVIQGNRIQWDAGDKAIMQAFLMINQTTSDNGQITYSAKRNSENGHADVAWAIMHALKYERLDSDGSTTTVTFSQ